MSNTPKANSKPFSLDRYRQDVQKDTAAKRGSFVLWLDDEHSIEIPRPNGDTLLKIEEAKSSRELMELLAGDRADEFFEAVGSEDFAVMTAIGDDIKAHFGLDKLG